MPLDHYVTLGRSGLRVSPFALGAMTFGEDPGARGHQRRGVREDPRRPISTSAATSSTPRTSTPTATRRRSSATGSPRIPGRRERVVARVEVLRQHVSRRPERRRRGPLGDHRPARTRRCAACRPTTSTCTGCTTGTATPRSRRRCAPSTTWCGAGKIRYIGFSNTPAWVTAQAQTTALLRGWTPLIALQVEYSLLARTVEGELAPLAPTAGHGAGAVEPAEERLPLGQVPARRRRRRLRAHSLRRRSQRRRVRSHRRRRRRSPTSSRPLLRRSLWPGCWHGPAPSCRSSEPGGWSTSRATSPAST